MDISMNQHAMFVDFFCICVLLNAKKSPFSRKGEGIQRTDGLCFTRAVFAHSDSYWHIWVHAERGRELEAESPHCLVGKVHAAAAVYKTLAVVFFDTGAEIKKKIIVLKNNLAYNDINKMVEYYQSKSLNYDIPLLYKYIRM